MKIATPRLNRRQLISGLASLAALPATTRVGRALTAAAPIVRSGTRIFTPSPDLVNLFNVNVTDVNANPTAHGVMPADLTSDGLGTYPQRINLGNFRGRSFIPPDAFEFTAFCRLFRAPIPSGAAGVDVSLLAMLDPTAFGMPSFKLLAKQATGPWLEESGDTVVFPNYTDAKGRDRCFYWEPRGNAGLLHCVPWIGLASYLVPDSYVMPTEWPVKNPGPSSLMLYFGGDSYTDASPYARTVTAHNSTIQSDGSAAFNGTSSYLSFPGNDAGMTFTGDFTIAFGVATNSKSNPHDGNQIRILSFGPSGLPALAIGIDPTSGAIVVFNEYVSQILTGHVNICNTGGNYHDVMLRRESGVLTLSIDGMQDGQGVADTTHWAMAPDANIGRLYGQSLGMFIGNINYLNIVNGVAL